MNGQSGNRSRNRKKINRLGSERVIGTHAVGRTIHSGPGGRMTRRSGREEPRNAMTATYEGHTENAGQQRWHACTPADYGCEYPESSQENSSLSGAFS